MGRPTEAPTIPPQATPLPAEAHLPEPTILPDLGSVPGFPPLDLPADAGTGIDVAVDVVPDFILDVI